MADIGATPARPALLARAAARLGSSVLAHASWLALALTLLAALVLRLVGLDHLPGINGDEAYFPVHFAEWRAGGPLAALRTGTHLPMNPVFFGAVGLAQLLLPQGFWAVRAPALLMSLLAVVLGWWCFRRRGSAFAVTFASLLAVLPIQLGYARLAWDPTAVPAAMVLALAGATRGSLLGTALAFALCVWVHPAAVFAAPLLASSLLVRRWPRDPAGVLRRPAAWVLAVVPLAALALGAAGSALYRARALPVAVLRVLDDDFLQRALERAADVAGTAQFAQLYADLLAGPTIYRYVAGSLPDGVALLHRGAFVLLLAGAVLPGLWRARGLTGAVDRALAVGLVVSLLGAYWGGGLQVLAPHTERYGMFLVAPSCYVVAACVDALARSERSAALLRLGTAALGVLLLLSFARCYLGALQRPDAERHVAFRTGPEEPKQRALHAILAARSPERTTLVRAEDWWLYWPLRYLASDSSSVFVTISGTRWDARYPRDFLEPPLEPEQTEVFHVAWADSRAHERLLRAAAQTIEVTGYAAEPILRVYRLPLVEPAGD